MTYGIEVLDENSNVTLSMNDFTVRRIHEETVPGMGPTAWVNGVKTDYYSITVPGYDPNKCFVVISPKVYNTSEQSFASNDLLTPQYIDVGGEVIGIIRYQQDNWFDRSNRVFRQRWRWQAVESVVEVFKVF